MSGNLAFNAGMISYKVHLSERCVRESGAVSERGRCADLSAPYLTISLPLMGINGTGQIPNLYTASLSRCLGTSSGIL